MKYKIILYGLLAALITGCSSAYKASQTPDDVYYSPARGNAKRAITKEDRYEDYVSAQEDQYLRMKTRNRNRWSSIDDYSYWNDSRYMPSYSYNYYRDNWNNFYSWNSPYLINNWNSPYYNSLYSGGYNSFGYYAPQLGYSAYNNVYISKYPVKLSSNVNRPALNGYTNRNYNNRNAVYNRQGLGNSIKRVFTPNENSSYSNRNINSDRNNTNNTYKAPERSYTPSSSAGGSSSGSSGGAGVSRPPRNR